MNEITKDRLAKNEALFREVNERIAESAQRFESTTTEFVCECSDAACTHRVEAELDTYEEVRADGARFLLAQGHGDARIERVVRKRRGYDIVEKFDARVAAVVRSLDPRASTA